jgi:hypothetical protein
VDNLPNAADYPVAEQCVATMLDAAGNPVNLFSDANPATVETQFAWMQGLMRSKAFLITLVLMFCATSVRAQVPVSPLTVSQTSVIRFTPAVPSGDVREGTCWTESIAVSRSGAWRCMVGNGISDPCFTIPGNRDRLVCGADPALKTDGFVLKLTKPLPKSSHPNRKAEPWVFRLADNSICEAMTGTLPAVNGEPARWSCAIHIRDQVRPAGVVTKLTPGKIWLADKFPESAIGTQGATPDKIPVKMIWE